MTAVIYLVIIAVWAAVLVPMWLRRHDHRRSQRPARGWMERAVQRLGQRTSVLGIPLPAHGAAQAGGQSHVDGTDDAASGDAAGGDGVHGAEHPPMESPGSPPRRRRRRRERGRGARRGRSRVSGAAKRRVILLLLLLSTTAVIAAVVLGLLAWPVLAAPVVLIAAFLLVAHRQVVVARRNRQRRERRRLGRESATVQASADAPPGDVLPPGTWLPRATPLPAYLRAAQDPQVSPAAPAWTAAAMLERAQRERQRAEREAGRDVAQRERVRAEQQAAALDDRDDTYLRGQAVRWRRGPVDRPFRRAANE